MKNRIVFTFLLFVFWVIGFAQNPWRDAVRQKLANAETDTSRVLAMAEMCSTFKFNRPDSAFFFGYNALTIARQIKFPKGELEAMLNLAITYSVLGNDAKAVQIALQGLKIAEKNNLTFYKAAFLFIQGPIYTRFSNYEKALYILQESYRLYNSVHEDSWSCTVQYFIGDTYIQMNQPDSALHYFQLVDENQKKANWVDYSVFFGFGKAQQKKGNNKLALVYLRQALGMTVEKTQLFDSNIAIAKIYQQTGETDSSIHYANNALLLAHETNFYPNIIDANLFLSGIYENSESKRALHYSKIALAYKDSLKNIIATTAEETFIEFDEQERQREIDDAKAEFQNRIRMNAFMGITFTLLVIAFFLYRNSRLKQKAKQNIEKAYEQLKSTQAQLIQSEKMASLGELTAGIAHEIQNPLNFVNNFSEVSRELIGEMNEELAIGNMQLAKEIAGDIEQNLEKINHHGKRAADIVKGMLQHSRTSSGQKEPTDINALADEYLRLAYHGLRAKDKSFNGDFKTEFDESLPKINVIPQDIGRVLLNLINNAFYAVDKKAKNMPPPPPKGGSKNDQTQYVPTVTISTASFIPPSGGPRGVRIIVKDNGDGIPPNIVDKIFQPFFTTKPTGQGTGLGLSLSYDIVKAHGGELKVETKEGVGSEFIIQLPVT